MTTKPAASQVVTDLGIFSTASVTPDEPTTYAAQLIVNDGFINSDPNSVTIQAILTTTDVIQEIQALQVRIAAMVPSDFKNANIQKMLMNKTNAVIKSIETGSYQEALDQLRNDILGKTDGCKGHPAGKPDKNDWIMNPQAQAALYPALLHIIGEMEAGGF
jgi:hypothetical protein